MTVSQQTPGPEEDLPEVCPRRLRRQESERKNPAPFGAGFLLSQILGSIFDNYSAVRATVREMSPLIAVAPLLRVVVRTKVAPVVVSTSTSLASSATAVALL